MLSNLRRLRDLESSGRDDAVSAALADAQRDLHNLYVGGTIPIDEGEERKVVDEEGDDEDVPMPDAVHGGSNDVDDVPMPDAMDDGSAAAGDEGDPDDDRSRVGAPVPLFSFHRKDEPCLSAVGCGSAEETALGHAQHCF